MSDLDTPKFNMKEVPIALILQRAAIVFSSEDKTKEVNEYDHGLTKLHRIIVDLKGYVFEATGVDLVLPVNGV